MKKCNNCNWEGKEFVDSPEGKNNSCPNCRFNPRHRLFVEFINNKFPKYNYSEHNVLEIAKSKTSEFLFQKFPKLTIIDNDIDKNIFEPNKPPEIYGDVTNLDYEDNYFDIITSQDVLEHVQDYNKALFEIYRVLKNNGLLILHIPLYADEGKIVPPEKINELRYHIGRSNKWDCKVFWCFTKASVLNLL